MFGLAWLFGFGLFNSVVIKHFFTWLLIVWCGFNGVLVLSLVLSFKCVALCLCWCCFVFGFWMDGCVGYVVLCVWRLCWVYWLFGFVACLATDVYVGGWVLVGWACLLWFEHFFVVCFNSVDIMVLYGMVLLCVWLLSYWFSWLC